MILNLIPQTYTQLFKMLGIGLFLMFIISCGNNETNNSSDINGPTIEEIQHIYKHYTEGHFSEYVSHIASCQGKPRFYREQVINLYKQQLAEQREMYGTIDSITIENITKTPDHQHATVLIRHYYSKSNPEEILLQMIYTEKGWKIK